MPRFRYIYLPLTPLVIFCLLLVIFPKSQHAKSCVKPPPGVVGWGPGDGNANDIRGGSLSDTCAVTAYGCHGNLGRSEV
jgi:hypothetical protein